MCLEGEPMLAKMPNDMYHGHMVSGGHNVLIFLSDTEILSAICSHSMQNEKPTMLHHLGILDHYQWGDLKIQRDAVTTRSVFSNIFTIYTLHLTCEGEVWGVGCREVIIWYTFCHCHHSAACNIVIGRVITALSCTWNLTICLSSADGNIPVSPLPVCL